MALIFCYFQLFYHTEYHSVDYIMELNMNDKPVAQCSIVNDDSKLENTGLDNYNNIETKEFSNE